MILVYFLFLFLLRYNALSMGTSVAMVLLISGTTNDGVSDSVLGIGGPGVSGMMLETPFPRLIKGIPTANSKNIEYNIARL